jgi:hypothetical protein
MRIEEAGKADASGALRVHRAAANARPVDPKRATISFFGNFATQKLGNVGWLIQRFVELDQTPIPSKPSSGGRWRNAAALDR